jgi:hypothetical protein
MLVDEGRYLGEELVVDCWEGLRRDDDRDYLAVETC